jgi:hypothetical protein
MSGRSRDTLLAQILTTAPYQLPPIVHGHGVYSLDIQYRGESFYKIGVSLEEVLESYYDFVTKFNYLMGPPRPEGLDLPVPQGKSIYSTDRPWHATK